ncbi:hypothetical protein T05_8407 [Trichinella murrelli]|uniref:Uncharacterized protein n=1 Tax=Trichinella murrelli TaxID=144512 RepID=A0A0V0SV27_9BILA|nr:hypothetical protein T05_8407 [Trichinella murrelli]
MILNNFVFLNLHFHDNSTLYTVYKLDTPVIYKQI